MVEAGFEHIPMPDTDVRRWAIEAIATLVHVKKVSATRLLRPAGVPDDMVRQFLTDRDPTTGEKLTKREAATALLGNLAQSGADTEVLNALLQIAANWSDFHLADEEYRARAVVQKARELQRIQSDSDARERAAYETRQKALERERQKERELTVRRQSELLLAQFDGAANEQDHHQRGYFLEDLLNRTFDLHGIPVLRSFRRNSGGEQIDAAFEIDGWHYLVECRWRSQLAGIRQLDGLAGQVARSGKQTMGMFLSIDGWSSNVVPLLKQNPAKAIFLMEGFDLRAVLNQQIELRRLLKRKISALNLDAEPYLPVMRVLAE